MSEIATGAPGVPHALHGDEARALAQGRHENPFSVLGAHHAEDGAVVRVFRPTADGASVIDETGTVLAELEPGELPGLFSGFLAEFPDRYRLRFRHDDATWEEEDPYRFGLVLGDLDSYLLAEGRHYKLYEKLGAHPAEMDGVEGVRFAVWAPNARRVSVVGDFNA